MDEKKITELIHKIITRGHNIGLHGSYNSSESEKQLKKELNLLKSKCSSLGQDKEIWSSRMHYLRWCTWTTAKFLSSAGINYDTTLGYAEAIGFRAGTCRPYKPFDPLAFVQIDIIIVPMLVMDSSIWGEEYMNLSDRTQMLEKVYSIVERTKEVNGVFNILWHNSDLELDWKKDIYSKVVSYAAV